MVSSGSLGGACAQPDTLNMALRNVSSAKIQTPQIRGSKKPGVSRSHGKIVRADFREVHWRRTLNHLPASRNPRAATLLILRVVYNSNRVTEFGAALLERFAEGENIMAVAHTLPINGSCFGTTHSRGTVGAASHARPRLPRRRLLFPRSRLLYGSVRCDGRSRIPARGAQWSNSILRQRDTDGFAHD